MNLFDLARLKEELHRTNKEIEQEDFWNNIEYAQKVMKDKKAMEDTIDGYTSLESTISDIEELIELAEMEEDEGLAEEILDMFDALKDDLEALRIKTLLNGKYDNCGAGGVDAMDWASMLLRMYTRWCDKKGYSVRMIDLQDDTEAGIKSATLIVEGENAYGYLKNEKGVHRLVRISPFNAAGKRQTSFAQLEVVPEIEEDLSVEIDMEDLRIDTYR